MQRTRYPSVVVLIFLLIRKGDVTLCSINVLSIWVVLCNVLCMWCARENQSIVNSRTSQYYYLLQSHWLNNSMFKLSNKKIKSQCSVDHLTPWTLWLPKVGVWQGYKIALELHVLWLLNSFVVVQELSFHHNCNHVNKGALKLVPPGLWYMPLAPLGLASQGRPVSSYLRLTRSLIKVMI